MPCHLSNVSLVIFDVIISSIPDFHAKPSGRFQRLRLKSCWLQQCRTNWRTEDLLGFSAFLFSLVNHVEVVRQTIGPANQLVMLVFDVSKNQMSWLCQICHVGKNTKERCSGIEAPFLLNSMHLDTKVERACTILCICHLPFAKWNCIMSHIKLSSE